MEQTSAITTAKNTMLMFHQPNMTLPVAQSTKDMPLIDDLTHRVFDIINYVILSGLIGLFGTVANVVNMTVFARIGIFTTASNLNLFSLAIADLGVAFTIFLQSMGYALIRANIQHLNFSPFDVVYITISWPNQIFVMANRLITPYVAFERCICVVFPFKVKTLFTTKRSIICLFILFAYSFISHIPIFATHHLGYVFQENRNISKLVLVFSAHSTLLYDIVINTNVFVVSFATVLLILVCTLITVSQIKSSAEWRKSVSSNAGSSNIDSNPVHKEQNSTTLNNESSFKSGNVVDSSKTSGKMSEKNIDKETRLVKMITMVSIIYIVLYMPEMVMIVVMFVDRRISTYGQYWRLSEVFYSFTYPTGALNSSINIFVYYRMSTAFRREFRKLFRMS